MKLLFALFLNIFALHKTSQAEVFYAKDEALEIAFSKEASVSQLSYILTPDQKETLEKDARLKIDSNLITFYQGKIEDRVIGYAAIDTRIMRTMAATYMVVLSPEGEVIKVVVLAFQEPLEYMPSDAWLAQFQKDIPLDSLYPGRGLAPIAGSTLSADSLSAGIRGIVSAFKLLLLK